MKKYQKLILGILFDAIGYASFVIPIVGEFSDIIWAPVSGWLMMKMYKGRPGKVAGYIAFVEELLPFVDVVPTFTIMWLYTYVYKSEERITKV